MRAAFKKAALKTRNKFTICLMLRLSVTKKSDTLLLPFLQVYIAGMKGLPPLNFIEPAKVFPNLRTFARIMTHFEPRK